MSAACRGHPIFSGFSNKCLSKTAAFDACLTSSVHDVVKRQVAAGIDSVCDGEFGKISYTFYVRHRLSGIGAFRGGANDRPADRGAS